MNDKLTYHIDWTLGQGAFRHMVKELIHQAEKKDKVIALPIMVRPGQLFLDQLTLLLAMVDCQGCDAPCCRGNPRGKPTHIIGAEYERLASKYGKEHFIVKDGKISLPMPCAFLRKTRAPNHGDLCSIYPDRPLVCAIYPFQTEATGSDGEPLLALDSSCPSARQLAKAIYMEAWQLRRQYRMLGEADFLKEFTLRGD